MNQGMTSADVDRVSAELENMNDDEQSDYNENDRFDETKQDDEEVDDDLNQLYNDVVNDEDFSDLLNQLAELRG